MITSLPPRSVIEPPAERPQAAVARLHARPPRVWTVAIYMVADGPSGNAALDQIAMDELNRIYAAARRHDSISVAVRGSRQR